jgi:hypothetical protein
MSGALSIVREVLAIFFPQFGKQSEWFKVSALTCFVLSCSFVMFRQRKKLHELENVKPTITGEFFNFKPEKYGAGGSYSFSIYVCEHRIRTSVKAVRVSTYKLSGEVERADGYPFEPFMGKTGQSLILEPGIGVTASVSIPMKTSPHFVNRLTIAVVDAFGNEHPLEPREKLPFPFFPDTEPAGKRGTQ